MVHCGSPRGCQMLALLHRNFPAVNMVCFYAIVSVERTKFQNSNIYDRVRFAIYPFHSLLLTPARMIQQVIVHADNDDTVSTPGLRCLLRLHTQPCERSHPSFRSVVCPLKIGQAHVASPFLNVVPNGPALSAYAHKKISVI